MTELFSVSIKKLILCNVFTEYQWKPNRSQGFASIQYLKILSKNIFNLWLQQKVISLFGGKSHINFRTHCIILTQRA